MSHYGDENCAHEWVYKPGNEIRQKRICKKCHRRERLGINDKENYYTSVFIGPPEAERSDYSPEQLIKDWNV